MLSTTPTVISVDEPTAGWSRLFRKKIFFHNQSGNVYSFPLLLVLSRHIQNLNEKMLKNVIGALHKTPYNNIFNIMKYYNVVLNNKIIIRNH